MSPRDGKTELTATKAGGDIVDRPHQPLRARRYCDDEKRRLASPVAMEFAVDRLGPGDRD